MAIVNSTQQISITIAASSATNTGAITAVDVSRSVAFFNGTTSAEASYTPNNSDVGIVLDASGTFVTAYRNGSTSSSITVMVTIVQFETGVIQSMQSGSIALGTATSNTASLSAITLANSAIVFQGSICSYSTNGSNRSRIAVYISSTTQVTAIRNTGTSTATAYFTVIEFASGILNSSTQAGTISMANGDTSQTATISSVTTGRTMTLFDFLTSNHGGAALSYDPYLTLTNGTTVTATSGNAGGTNARTAYFNVAEFKSSQIKTLSRGTITIAASNTSNTATLSPSVTVSKTLINFTGTTNPSETAYFGKAQSSITFTNSSTLTANRATSGTDTSTLGYEAIEYSETFTASGAITEHGDTVAGAAIVTFSASASITENRDTPAGAAVLSFKASAAITEHADTVDGAATTSVNITASGAVTEGMDVAVGVAVLAYSGAGAITEAPDVVAGASYIAAAVSASGDITENPDGVSGDALLQFIASASITEGPDSVDGVAYNAASASGSGAVTENPDTVAGAALLIFTGAGTITERPDAVDSSASGLYVYGDITENMDMAAGAAVEIYDASGNVMEAPDVVAGAAVSTSEVLASGAVTEAPDGVAGAAIEEYEGAGDIAEAPDTVNGSASNAENITAIGDVTEAGDAVAGAGTLIFIASAAVQESGDIVAGAAALSGSGSGNIQENSDIVAGQSCNYLVSGDFVEGQDMVDGAGSYTFTGAGDISEGQDIAAGIAGIFDILATGDITEGGDIAAGLALFLPLYRIDITGYRIDASALQGALIDNPALKGYYINNIQVGGDE